MPADYTGAEAINAEVADAMFRRFAKLMNNPSALGPQWNEETGRYSNESIANWLDLYADGLVYGVRVPLYDYSPLTTAIKTGANAGLVLEPSTEVEAGRNDYEGRKLFMCPRVNGGVDADGMPYVTAIEGMDDRFDAAAFNTFALRPVYWRRYVKGSQYYDKEFTDGPRDGFSPVRGAYTSDGELRPYILRACYMDSDGQFSSKSGTVPAAYYSGEVEGKVAHSASNDFAWSKSRTADGLTYLDYGDVTEQIDFMQLMLGVKAPREKAVGCVSYSFQYTVAAAESGVRRVLLTDAQAANVLVGSRVSVGSCEGQTDRNYAVVHDVAKSAKVLSKTALGDGTTAINLDLAADIAVTATCKVTSMPWANGSCDGVLGMYGSPTEAGLTNGKEPFRFLNVEWQLGLYEVVHNMFSMAVVDEDGTATHAWRVAPDVSDCSGIGASATGWTVLQQVTEGLSGVWRYIKDYVVEKGASVVAAVAGTSTTGYRSAWYPSASSGDREHLVGGSLDGGAAAGVGCAYSGSGLSDAGWSFGGRASAVGHSAPAE